MLLRVRSNTGLGRCNRRLTMLTDKELQDLRNMGNECEESAAEIDLLREMLDDLAKAVWMLDRAGYIGTDDDASEAECATLRRIALQTVDTYTAYRRPND